MDTEPQRLAQQTMAFVLAGGRGSRLYELTDIRAKPAMYFGGKIHCGLGPDVRQGQASNVFWRQKPDHRFRAV